jgi:hypothetical protein
MLVATGSAFAQGAVSGIVGTVTDTSGGALPGVTVIVTGPALQVPQVDAVTNEHGEYRVSPLPPGTFSVSYELSGFQTVKRDNVQLGLGFVATLDQVLGVGSVQESITVSGGSPLVDVTNPATSIIMSSETVDSLPTTRDGLKAVMSLMPGVRPNLEVGASGMTNTIQFRVYGQSGQSWQMLDGIMFSAPNSGGANGSHVDLNVLDSTRVQTVGSDAEMPRRGVMLDAVMKSGGNDFHGGFVAYGSSGGFESVNTDDALQKQGVRGVAGLHQLWDYSGNGGGRLIKNTLWFYGGLRTSGFDRDILNAFNADGSAMQVNTQLDYRSIKLAYQANQANHFSGFYHYALEFQRRGGNQFTPTESRNVYWGPIRLDGVSWQIVRGNSLVASLQGGEWYQDARNYAEPGYDNPANHKVTTIDTFTQNVTGDSLNDGTILYRWRRHAKGAITYYKSNLLGGTHQFKVGFDFLASAFNQNQGSRPAGNYRLRFNNGTAFQIETLNYPVQPVNNDRYLGVYGQDSWKVNSRLTLSLGLRFSRDNLFAPPQCQAATDFSVAGCWDLIQMRIWDAFAPRAHFAMDLSGDGRTSLKGGWGRFAQLRDISPDLTNANRNGGQTTTWTWHDLNNNRNYDPGEVNLNPNGPDFRSIAGVTNAVPNPNENQPKTDEFSLTFERELPGHWGFRTTGVYAYNFDLRRLAEPLRPRSAYSIAVTNPDPGFDGIAGNADDPGRTITYFEYPAALNGAAFAGTMYVNADGKQTYKTIEVAATRRPFNNWFASASYSATKTNSPFDDGQADNPNSEIFTANQTWELTGKVSGGYNLPKGVNVSGGYEFRNGAPQARSAQFVGGRTITQIVLNVEPIGSIDLPNAHLVSMRLAKNFRFTKTQSMEARFDCYNVLNTNFVTTRTTRAGSAYLVPTAIIEPRILQMGLTYTF